MLEGRSPKRIISKLSGQINSLCDLELYIMYFITQFWGFFGGRGIKWWNSASAEPCIESRAKWRAANHGHVSHGGGREDKAHFLVHKLCDVLARTSR